MKKEFLKHLNILLGTVSVALAGCHVQKNVNPAPETANDTTNISQPVVDQPTEPEAVCLYGVPADVYRRPTRKYGVPDAAE